MVPTITPITSIVAYGVGVYFEFQPHATNTPTGWTIGGLPDGMAADAITGLITGSPTAFGVYDVSFIATNGSGDSAEVVAPFVVGVGYGLQEPVILLDFNLETALITGGPAVGTALLFGKTADKILVALGFIRDGILVPQTLESITLSLKELEPEALIDLTTGGFRIAWTSDGPRYIFLVDLTDAVAPLLDSVISNYEADADTFADFVAQIRINFEVVVLSGEDPSVLPRTSQNFKFRISRSLEP